MHLRMHKDGWKNGTDGTKRELSKIKELQWKKNGTAHLLRNLVQDRYICVYIYIHIIYFIRRHTEEIVQGMKLN